MLQIKNISKRFGGVRALDKCSFKIEENKITALIGPNGAGKTTLFDVISGLVPPDEGSVNLQLTTYRRHSGIPPGRDNLALVGLRPDQVAAAGITRTWQQVRLFKYLTIEDHLRLAADNEDTKLLRNLVVGTKQVSTKQDDLQLTTYRRHSGIPPGRDNLQLKSGDFSAFTKHFGLDKPLNTLVSELSYGQRKLLQLAMAVLQPHKLLLLDEPVAGVNKVIQEKIEKILLHLKGKGETIVIIEHDIEFVKKLADHVVVMDEGKVLTQGQPSAVLQDKRVLEAYLGE